MKVGDKVALGKSPRFEYAMADRYTNYVVGGIKEISGERRLKLLDEQGIQISRDATYDGHSYYADDFYVVEEWKEEVMADDRTRAAAIQVAFAIITTRGLSPQASEVGKIAAGIINAMNENLKK